MPVRDGQFASGDDLPWQLNFPPRRAEPDEDTRSHQAVATTELDDVRTLSVDVVEHGEQRKGWGDVVRETILRMSTLTT